MVKTLSFHYRGMGVIPGWGTKIPHAVQCGREKKRKKTSKTKNFPGIPKWWDVLGTKFLALALLLFETISFCFGGLSTH